MSGLTNLEQLIRSMEPVLAPERYIFVTLQPDELLPYGLKPRMVFEEEEGTTVICRQSEAADYHLNGQFPCRMITLNVHSSLEAVGFIARIATRLAAEGMGVNPVSGYFHDHLFVPESRADDALDCLRAMITEVGA
ncbi:ACT domain-containing protein [Aestuariispira insulae]|uniref:DUF2241 domain-containing protein n=1 Tax=Aestuariispira insulae TaxID=1461337 RepID=A0A3D9H3Y4_9PROT|nr:ACT domain-containing protein [Aestuariispira insulae]RED44209.1 hypothetical protein DFP90_11650 [Aestuariispira insulae]